ncbi:MAG: ABC transporter substrate-binding protein [Pseudomonadota bacterium]
MRLFRILGLALLIGAVPLSAHARGDTAVYAFYTDMRDWDPAIAFSEESWVLLNVYETLLRYEPNLETGAARLVPVLAKNWSVSESGLVWRFELREGINFHDGTAFNASAAKQSLDRTIRIGQGGAYIWDGVTEIRAVSEYVLEIETSRPMPIDLIASAQYAAYIYSPKSAEQGTNWFNKGNGAGTGPYTIRRWRRGQDVVLDRFEDYWQGWREGQFRRAIVKVVREAVTQTQMLRAGDADFISNASVEVTATALTGDESLVVSLSPSWINKQFLINTSRYPTDNLNFRRALMHAWDYDSIVEGVYLGGATRSKGLIPATMWGHDPDFVGAEFDLAKASEFLSASGVPDADRKITIRYVAGQPDFHSAALNFQRNLSTIGIEATLEPGPWGQIWSKARNQSSASHMISMTWWPTYPTPGDWLKGLFYTEKRPLFNLSFYANPKFDALVDEGFAQEGSDRRLAMNAFRAAQEILVEDAVAIFYADLMNRRIHRADVEYPAANPAYNAIFFYDAVRLSP